VSELHLFAKLHASGSEDSFDNRAPHTTAFKLHQRALQGYLAHQKAHPPGTIH
jgi:hypothetical protein